MSTRIHPLTGQPLGVKTASVQPRAELAELGLWHGLPGENRSAANRSTRPTHKSSQSYDAARTGTDLDGHWAFADSLTADDANNQGVRQKLVTRSRYETGSNAYYAGILRTHCNMLVGVGPTLRMLTGNRTFNQLVEREWFAWTQRVQLRRKLWAMAHARTQDGEAFAVLQTNPIYENGVQLDLTPIETEQCQSPYGGIDDLCIDGVRLDEFGNVVAYDILPHHPGSSRITWGYQPIQVGASNMLHWFRMERPGSHRGIPDLTSSLNVGALSRRSREATVKAQETAASIGALMTTGLNPAGDSEPDPIAPFSQVEWVHKMLMAAPMGWDVRQLKGEHPNAQYADFHRLQISEQSRPLNMPYNAAAGDSSTYSFASGKLDTLCYRAAIDVERQDCNDLVLDPLFAQWFREWTIVTARRDIPPAHQWDWPLHPVIDAVQEATATNTKLQNGTISLRQVYSDQGQDLEDQLAIMAEDTFGEANDETIAKMRQICVLKNTPAHAIQHVAQILGVQVETASQGQPEMPSGQTDNEEEDANELAETA